MNAVNAAPMMRSRSGASAAGSGPAEINFFIVTKIPLAWYEFVPYIDQHGTTSYLDCASAAALCPDSFPAWQRHSAGATARQKHSQPGALAQWGAPDRHRARGGPEPHRYSNFQRPGSGGLR